MSTRRETRPMLGAPLSILLPGLDGTAKLFEPFVLAAPPGLRVRAMALPNDRPRGYRELADWLLTELPQEPIVLIAESFSGPLALLVADRCPRVVAVVLCASFVQAPLPRFFANLPGFIWNRPPPAALIRFFLTGGDRLVADAVRSAVAGVEGRVIAGRVESVLRVDVTAELGRLSRPLLFLRATHDRVVPARSSRRVRALRPSTCFAELAAPHLVLQTHATEAWAQIAPFIVGLQPR